MSIFSKKNHDSDNTFHLKGLIFAAIESAGAGLFLNCLQPGKEGIVYINKYLVSTLEYPDADQLTGKHVGTLFDEQQPDDKTVADLVMDVESTIKEKGVWSGPARYRTRSGRAIEVMADVTVTVYDGIPYALSVIRDLSNSMAKQKLSVISDDFDRDIGGAVLSVGDAAESMRETARSLISDTQRTAEGTSNLATATDRMTEAMRSMTTTTDRLSSSITTINRQVEDSTAAVKDALDQARSTGDIVGELASAAKRIGDVLKLIQGIAAQTNLLALNATIEAARAGEAGKGFAVVAGEVKTLANQTANATEDISSQVSEIQTVTEQTVEAINAIGLTINRVDAISGAISSAMQDQSQATRDMASHVATASNDTEEVNRVLEMLRNLAANTQEAAQATVDKSSALSDLSSNLDTEARDFLETLRKSYATL